MYYHSMGTCCHSLFCLVPGAIPSLASFLLLLNMMARRVDFSRVWNIVRDNEYKINTYLSTYLCRFLSDISKKKLSLFQVLFDLTIGDICLTVLMLVACNTYRSNGLIE